MIKCGWFGYGGNHWLAEQLRDRMPEGTQLLTCHEYENANVKWTEGFHQEEIYKFIDSLDIVILPQRWTQPSKSANRLALAWSRKKACIVERNHPAYQRYVVDGFNAINSETGPEAFLGHIKILSKDKELREKLGNNGYQTAMSFLHPRDYHRRYLAELTSPTFLTIIIPHYASTLSYLDWSVKSAVEARGPDREIIVVSSSSIKPEYKQYSNVRVVHSAQRMMFSKANNVGIDNASPKTTHFLLLNDDTIVSEHALDFMLLSTKGRKDIILNPYSNCDQGWLHNDQITIPWVRHNKGVLHPGMAIDTFSGGDLCGIQKFTPSVDSSLIPSPFCAFYATLIPKEVIDKVGKLSEQYSNGGEDADYCYRAQRLGIQSYWTKAAFVFHFGGKTRKFSQDNDPKAHEIEDKLNNDSLHRRWQRGQKKRLAIWTGPAWEDWSLDSPYTTGIGGSETCAIRLAEAAANHGWSVTMIGQHPNQVRGDIETIHFSEFKPQEWFFDVYLSSRNLFGINGEVRAKKKLLWIHDIWMLSGKEVSQYYRDTIDKFVCLTPWHKNFVMQHHNLPNSAITIVPNGVDTEIFNGASIDTKVYGKLHYSSSPDRGLDNLIYCLPFIKEKVPEAHVDVYYGFHTWKSMVEQSKDDSSKEKMRYLLSLIDNVKDSVHFKDRVNQKELSERWRQAYVWGYPTQFWETYCITANEAQLSHTPIVCSNEAALETTVGNAGHRIMHNPYTKEGRIEFVDQIVKLHKDKDYWLEMSKKSFSGAKRVDWNSRWKDYWEPLFLS